MINKTEIEHYLSQSNFITFTPGDPSDSLGQPLIFLYYANKKEFEAEGMYGKLTEFFYSGHFVFHISIKDGEIIRASIINAENADAINFFPELINDSLQRFLDTVNNFTEIIFLPVYSGNITSELEYHSDQLKNQPPMIFEKVSVAFL